MELTVLDSQADGGCNFCNRHECDAQGVTPKYPVYMIQRSTGGMSPRFCAECLADLTVLISGVPR